MTNSPKTNTPRENTKSQRLLEMLKTGTGASLDDMIEATGWQAHTVRAAMTGLRKRGHAINRHVEGNTVNAGLIPGH
jgi:hypothetical protein